MRVYPALSTRKRSCNVTNGGVYDAALRRRSVRLFKQKKIPFRILKKLINVARLAPSAANLQPCEFVVVDRQKTVKTIFPALKWAGYIKPEGNPLKDKQPSAYIVALINKKKESFDATADVSAAIENILLVAEEQGLGSCWLGAIDRKKIQRILNIPRYCEVRYVLALGYPDEQPKVESLKTSVRYWKDKKGRLHVPKRSLKAVMHRNRYK